MLNPNAATPSARRIDSESAAQPPQRSSRLALLFVCAILLAPLVLLGSILLATLTEAR